MANICLRSGHHANLESGNLHSAHQRATNTETVKMFGQSQMFHTLVEEVPEEFLAKCQDVKLVWEGHSFEALVELTEKGQTLQVSW